MNEKTHDSTSCPKIVTYVCCACGAGIHSKILNASYCDLQIYSPCILDHVRTKPAENAMHFQIHNSCVLDHVCTKPAENATHFQISNAVKKRKQMLLWQQIDYAITPVGVHKKTLSSLYQPKPLFVKTEQ